MKVEEAVVGSASLTDLIRSLWTWRKQHLKMLCERGGGRRGLVPNRFFFSFPDLKQMQAAFLLQWVGWLFQAQASPVDLIWSLWTWRKQHLQMKKPDISELRSCVQVEVDVQGSLRLSVDVK